jgi:carbon monoxide dehydrogenase subunit G
MELEQSFTVPVGIEQAWAVLTDIEQVAPCMPGAALDSVDGDDFTGTVKVKLGSINLTYKGKASFVTKDADAHRAVIDARGKDARGNGTAAATVTATLHEEGSGTRVEVLTDLQITGKPAQFGRGVMADVGNKLIGQFADCLAGRLGAPEPSPPAQGPADQAAPATPAAAPAPTPTPAPDSVPTPAAAPAATRPEPQPIDLLQLAGPALLKRLAPVALAAVVLVVLLRLRRRCRAQR